MGFRSCIVPESDEGESSGDECGSAAAEAASDSESESSLLEQAIRAAGDVCGPSTSAVETGYSHETGTSSDEDASHCETLGTDDSSDVSYSDVSDVDAYDSDVRMTPPAPPAAAPPTRTATRLGCPPTSVGARQRGC